MCSWEVGGLWLGGGGLSQREGGKGREMGEGGGEGEERR